MVRSFHPPGTQVCSCTSVVCAPSGGGGGGGGYVRLYSLVDGLTNSGGSLAGKA